MSSPSLPSTFNSAPTSFALAAVTSALAGGQHKITGAYSGDATYAAAQAGPITQTVNGKAPTTSSGAGALNVHGLWWGGAAESGWGVNVAQQGGTVFDSSFVITHRIPLAKAPKAYEMFAEKRDGCIKVVLDPAA